jgi:replication factor C small subunit
MSELWVEKHRPRSVSEIRGQPAVVQRLAIYAEKKQFPHLLFAGPPGTGKTTAAMALTKDVFGDNYKENLLEMNASDERKLESIRTKVKQFARTSPYGGAAFKIIFLDEADALTNDAQGALRRNNMLRHVDLSCLVITLQRLLNQYNLVVQCFDLDH